MNGGLLRTIWVSMEARFLTSDDCSLGLIAASEPEAFSKMNSRFLIFQNFMVFYFEMLSNLAYRNR
jgi:hypothetical protein